MLQKDDDWGKKCIEYEVKGPRPRRSPKRTWTNVVEKRCQACKLNKEDAMDHSKWRKLIKDVNFYINNIMVSCFCCIFCAIRKSITVNMIITTKTFYIYNIKHIMWAVVHDRV